MIICSNRVEAIDESCGKCHKVGFKSLEEREREREMNGFEKRGQKTQADHQIIIIK